MRVSVAVRLLLATAAAGAIAGCAQKPRVNAREKLGASYTVSTSHSYHDVQLIDTALVYTFCVAPETIVDTGAAHCFLSANRTLRSAVVSRPELEDLAAVVNNSGFLSLPETCGGKPGDTLGGVYSLKVGSFYQEKNVVYLSFDGATPPPPAYGKVGAALAAMVQAKFGQPLELPQ